MKSDRSILLVEDDADDAMLTIRAIRQSGFANQVVVMSDGCEALEYLFGKGRYANRDIFIMPALVLLDLKLPCIDGFEVLRSIRDDAVTGDLPVIILTNSKNPQVSYEAFSLGANGFISKPQVYENLVFSFSQLGLA